MQNNVTTPQYDSQETTTPEVWKDFLTPEQRLDMIAELLGKMALEVVRRDHEQNPSHTA